MFTAAGSPRRFRRCDLTERYGRCGAAWSQTILAEQKNGRVSALLSALLKGGKRTLGRSAQVFTEEDMSLKEWLLAVGRKIDGYERSHNDTCDLCGAEVFENERICARCKSALPHNNGAICPFCGRKTGEAGACLECKAKPLGVSKARSAFTHEGDAVRLVLSFKRGKRYLYAALGELLLPVLLAEFAESKLLVGVPMTKKALKKRGYNQSYLLAEELARLSGKEYKEVAEKRRETEAQKTLGRAEREENLKGCFRIVDRRAVAGKSVLIVDDIMTTGSTASELAAVLKRAGATEVMLLTATSVTAKDFPKSV